MFTLILEILILSFIWNAGRKSDSKEENNDSNIAGSAFPAELKGIHESFSLENIEKQQTANAALDLWDASELFIQ